MCAAAVEHSSIEGESRRSRQLARVRRIALVRVPVVLARRLLQASLALAPSRNHIVRNAALNRLATYTLAERVLAGHVAVCSCSTVARCGPA